jgi:hypothetical protein
MVGSKRGARYFLSPDGGAEFADIVDSGSIWGDSTPNLVDSGTKSVDSGSEFVDFTSSSVDSSLSMGETEANAETHARLQQIAAPAMARAYLAHEMILETIVQLCHTEPLTVREIATLLNRTEHHVGQKVRALVADNRLRPLEPGRRMRQRYVALDER